MGVVQKLQRWVLSSLSFYSVVASPPAVAAARRCEATQEQLLSAIRSTHEKQQNVGVQVAIDLDRQLVFSGVLGMMDRVERRPVTRETRFPVASVTKALTGIATL